MIIVSHTFQSNQLIIQLKMELFSYRFLCHKLQSLDVGVFRPFNAKQ